MDASATGPTGEVHGSLQNSREVEISFTERTGSSANGAASPESHREARSRVGQRSVLKEQFPGPGGHQNRHAEKAVGPHGELFPRTASGVLGCSAEPRSCDSRKRQEGRSNWKRYHDRSPPSKFSARGETNTEQLIHENMALVDLEDRSCSDRASVIDPRQELRADRPISSNLNEKLDWKMEMKYDSSLRKTSGRLDQPHRCRRTMRVVGSLSS